MEGLFVLQRLCSTHVLIAVAGIDSRRRVYGSSKGCVVVAILAQSKHIALVER